MHKKNLPYLIAAGIIILLIIIAVITGLRKEYKSARDAEVSGQKVVYSILENKIVSKGPEVKVEQPLTKANPNLAAAKISEPRIVIIISNIGLSASLTKDVFTLPPSVTFGLSPYGNNISDIAAMSSKDGHDVLINLPMQPLNYPVDDAGPLALLVNLPDKDNIDRLNEIEKMANGIAGFYTLDNESFSSSWNNMKTVLEYLKAKGYSFVYGGGHSSDVSTQVANNINYKSIFVTDTIIDSEITQDAIKAKLAKLEQIALENGVAIGLARTYPVSIKLLRDWIETLKSKNIKIVGIKEISGASNADQKTTNSQN